MKHLLLLALLSFPLVGFGQNVGIGTATPAASAKLDVTSTNSGVLIPRVALTATNAAGPIAAPATSLIVYNTATAGAAPNNVTPGYYYWNGSAWVRVIDQAGWTILGNTGTTAGTNFIGTTDAQAFVVKTGGSAATNERMRFLSTGATVINNTTPTAGDVFSVYGTGTIGAINGIGASVINGYSSGGGTGVYGESTSAAANEMGTALWGNLNGTITTTQSYGVWGTNASVPQGAGITYGVQGWALGTTGDARGVSGETESGDGAGTAGINNSTTGSGIGVYSQSSSNAGIAMYAVNSNTAYTTNTAVGVYGRTEGTITSGFSIGVRANVTAPTGINAYGVYSQVASTAGTGGIAFVTSSGAGWQGQNAGTGDGMRAYNTSTAATAGDGIYGQAAGATAKGGSFQNTNASGTGVMGVGNNASGLYLTAGSGGAFTGTATGLFAYTTNTTNALGVFGVSNGAPLNFLPSGVNGTSTIFGVSGLSTSTTNGIMRAGGYFDTGGGQSYAYVGARTAANVVRKIEGNGTVNTTVKDVNNKLVVLSCPEAPENFFQDYGSGRLVNGKAHITLDPNFAKNIVVNEQHPLRVFIQLEGDCSGVFVTNKSQNGFDVSELMNGVSNVDFSWTVTANRADEIDDKGNLVPYSQERFAPAMGPQKLSTFEGQTKSNERVNEIRKPAPEMKLINKASVNRTDNLAKLKKQR